MKAIARYLLLCAALAFALESAAADKHKYRGAFRGSKVRIEGTSTIHPWYSESGFVRGNLELDPSFPTDPASKELQPGKVDATAKISIVVQTFRCSSGSAMDAVMQDAMDAKNHKTIEYTLKDLVFKEFKDDAMLFDATGDLMVHGTAKTITMPVQITRPDAKTIKVTATTDTKMSEFGIKPPAPKLLGGAIKTGDEVKLIIEWTAQKLEGS
jgi:polyisoprenoid-binding protein YceI